MNTSQQPQATRMFARVIGPFLVVIPATVVIRASDMQMLLSNFTANPVWSWVTGAFVLLFGLVVIALHQYWRTTAAVIVSVAGWLVTLKGLFLLAFPRTYLSFANSAIDEVNWWKAGFAVFVLIGVYLTYIGWASASRRPTAQTAGTTRDLPRAA